MRSGRSHISAQATWIAMMDLACLVMGSVLGVSLRLGPEEIPEYVFNHIDGWLLLFSGVLLANYLAGSYRLQYTFSRFNLVVTWMFSLVFTMLILSVTSYAWFKMILGRGVLFFSLASYSGLALALKLLVYRSLFRNEIFLCRTAIVGTGDQAAEIKATVERDYVLPVHKVVACIRILDDATPAPVDRAAIRGVAIVEAKAEEIEAVIRSLDVNVLIIGLDEIGATALFYPQLKRLRFAGIEVLGPLSVAEVYQGKTPLNLISEDFLVQASMESSFPVVRRVKRMFDVVFSLLALVVFFPLMLLIAVLIKLSEPRSPVFYTQSRVGHFSRAFRIVKFRTMKEGAEAASGPVWAAHDDARITRLGRVLRRFRLDELPQLINILRGEMSIVGPRPERPELTKELEKNIPFYNERENVMPGLTGWAQIRFRYGSTVEDAARKLEYDLYYIKHLSLSLDLQIVLSTLRIVLMGKERRI